MPRSLDTVQTEYLVLTAQFGDVAAFAELLRRWLPIMRRHAARLTADPTATDDVVQEACLALVSALKRLDDPSRAHGWMLRIVSNKAADWVRTRRRERVLTHSLPARSPPDAHRDSPEARFEHTIQAAEIRAACLALPIHLRT
ncbi:MAG: RNA polymerase sigma factor, partial [Phycisphaerales bacterium]